MLLIMVQHNWLIKNKNTKTDHYQVKLDPLNSQQQRVNNHRARKIKTYSYSNINNQNNSVGQFSNGVFKLGELHM